MVNYKTNSKYQINKLNFKSIYDKINLILRQLLIHNIKFDGICINKIINKFMPYDLFGFLVSYT